MLLLLRVARISGDYDGQNIATSRTGKSESSTRQTKKEKEKKKKGKVHYRDV